MTGRLIAIVGPSGVGKDSVMAGMVQNYPGYMLARRVITRPKDAGGEDYHAVSEPVFHDMVAAGAFALHWPAHGLWYGIPQLVRADLAQGRNVLVNLSRKILPLAVSEFPSLQVIVLTASPAVLAARLAERGRETALEIERRLAQADMQIPSGVPYLTVANEGPMHQTLADLHAALYPHSVVR